jgi:hypothetical protein
MPSINLPAQVAAPPTSGYGTGTGTGSAASGHQHLHHHGSAAPSATGAAYLITSPPRSPSGVAAMSYQRQGFGVAITVPSNQNTNPVSSIPPMSRQLTTPPPQQQLMPPPHSSSTAGTTTSTAGIDHDDTSNIRSSRSSIVGPAAAAVVAAMASHGQGHSNAITTVGISHTSSTAQSHHIQASFSSPLSSFRTKSSTITPLNSATLTLGASSSVAAPTTTTATSPKRNSDIGKGVSDVAFAANQPAASESNNAAAAAAVARNTKGVSWYTRHHHYMRAPFLRRIIGTSLGGLVLWYIVILVAMGSTPCRAVSPVWWYLQVLTAAGFGGAGAVIIGNLARKLNRFVVSPCRIVCCTVLTCFFYPITADLVVMAWALNKSCCFRLE